MAAHQIAGSTIQRTFVAICVLLAMSGACGAQNPIATPSAAAPNAVVKADSLPVYSEMRGTSLVGQSLKKGDAVVLEFELRTTARWCSVRQPGQASRLGYVHCEGLEKIAPHAAGAPSGATNVVSPGAGPARSSPKDIALPPPRNGAISGYDQIAALAVREGAIDAVKMNEFDVAARGGSPDAMSRAALAHFAAGTFELSRTSLDEAVEQFQDSLNYSAGRPDLQFPNLLTLAYIDLVQSQYSAALDYLARARRLEPRSAAVAGLSGWAYYGLNQIDEAIRQWQSAQQIQPTEGVARALAKAQRDRAAESEARQTNSGHFMLRYQGGATPELAKEILDTLEGHYRTLESEFHYTPPEPIGVVLYTEQAFRDVLEMPAWAGAGNDGRIRVPVQGLTSVSDQLSRELMHELTHSFIQQKTLGRCPGWLNEGLAQWFEGRRSDRDAAALIAVYDNGHSIPFQRLEGSWAGMSGPTARYAYAWSLAAVESIMESSGMWGVQRLFDRFNVDPNFEAALSAALQTDYTELEQRTVAHLRQTYSQ